MTTRRICFLTTNDFGFGGSEDLWIGTAKWLVRLGHDILASVRRWDPCPELLQSLATEGCRMFWRDFPPSERDVASVVQQRADVVVVAHGYQLEGVEWLCRLVAERSPFVITNNCVHELGWPGLDEREYTMEGNRDMALGPLARLRGRGRARLKSATVPMAGLADVLAINDFFTMLPSLVEKRRGIQVRRRREDAKITPLFLDPFLAVESPPEYSELQGEILRFFGLDRVLKAAALLPGCVSRRDDA
jgi:hypothetical protein